MPNNINCDYDLGPQIFVLVQAAIKAKNNK